MHSVLWKWTVKIKNKRENERNRNRNSNSNNNNKNNNNNDESIFRSQQWTLPYLWNHGTSLQMTSSAVLPGPENTTLNPKNKMKDEIWK